MKTSKIGERLKEMLLSLLLVAMIPQSAVTQTNRPTLLLRLDDNGMNHSVNMAIKRVAETGIPFSTSVMFTCPWYQEAVAVLKDHPNVSVGVHLVLNSEWKNYRWGPVLGRTAVPSLVGVDGYFLHSTDEFLASKYKLDEVEKELAAQIKTAVNSGLKIDYVDYHMWTAISTPELRAIVEKLAKENHLGISRYFAENYQSMFDVSIETKKQEFFQRLSVLPQTGINLVVMHVAEDTPEMEALIDMNDPGMHSETRPLVALHRSTELDILLSPQFQEKAKNGSLKFATYRDLVHDVGLEKMHAPPEE
jgi:predicted glycoside hydrolase/deacetylase ChbG (UPF0249 family)